MIPVVTFPDAPTTVANAIRSLLADAGHTVGVGKHLPTGRVTDDGTHLVCVQDAGGVQVSTAVEVADVRVIVWDQNEDTASDLARLAHALITAKPVTGTWNITSAEAVAVTFDPDSGEPMAVFTVTVRLKPNQP